MILTRKQTKAMSEIYTKDSVVGSMIDTIDHLYGLLKSIVEDGCERKPVCKETGCAEKHYCHPCLVGIWLSQLEKEEDMVDEARLKEIYGETAKIEECGCVADGEGYVYENNPNCDKVHAGRDTAKNILERRNRETIENKHEITNTSKENTGSLLIPCPYKKCSFEECSIRLGCESTIPRLLVCVHFAYDVWVGIRENPELYSAVEDFDDMRTN